MKQLIATICAMLMLIHPAAAQGADDADVAEGFDLMEEGARLMMRGLLSEIDPAITDLRDSLEQMGPAFAEFARAVGPAFAALLDQVDDIRNYAAPEFLPNGDIIIRRIPDAPEWLPDMPEGEIEL